MHTPFMGHKSLPVAPPCQVHRNCRAHVLQVGEIYQRRREFGLFILRYYSKTAKKYNNELFFALLLY